MNEPTRETMPAKLRSLEPSQHHQQALAAGSLLRYRPPALGSKAAQGRLRVRHPGAHVVPVDHQLLGPLLHAGDPRCRSHRRHILWSSCPGSWVAQKLAFRRIFAIECTSVLAATWVLDYHTVVGSVIMERIAVLLTEAESAHFDAYCQTKGYKKSPLIARLIREHLDREGFSHQPDLLGAAATKQAKTESETRHDRHGGATTTERD